MNEATATHQGSGAQTTLDEALAAIEKALQDPSLSEAERQACLQELRQLEEQRARLTDADLRVAVFGVISAGKSSLLNALTGERHFATAVRGGETRQPSGRPWTFSQPGFPPVTVIDTPGIGEVGGEERGLLALQAARDADLVLFVAEKDLTQPEMDAFRDLASVGKPIIFCLNKRDNYSPAQQQELRDVLRERLAGLVEPESVVLVASDPKEVQRVRERPDGSEEVVWRKPKPDLEELQVRLLEVLERAGEGQDLVALNVLLKASDAGERMATKRAEIRRREADVLTVSYALFSGVAVGLTPVPFVDLLSKLAVDAAMVYQLGGRIYQEDIDKAAARTLVAEIAKGMGALAAVQVAKVGLGSLLKSVPVLGTLAGAAVQGVTASYYTFAFGQVAIVYFEQRCSWGGRSVKAVTKDVMDRLKAHRGVLTDEFKGYIANRVRGEPASLVAVVRRLRGAGALG